MGKRERKGGGKLRLLFLLPFLGAGKPLASFPADWGSSRNGEGRGKFHFWGRAEFAS